jgi:ubiquinone/menaquinone biosynthesis C-methylase UbiE
MTRGRDMHARRFTGDITRLRSPERVERLEVKRVVQLCLEEGSFKTALDVGTGSGLFAEEFVKNKLNVVGIDVNHEMLLVARQACALVIARGDETQCRFVEATAEEPPFANGSFDMAFYGLVLHETDDALKALQAARRLSRKRVCILEWPFREQSDGPPLADRLSPFRLEGLFRQAGYSRWERTELNNTVLYRLEG